MFDVEATPAWGGALSVSGSMLAQAGQIAGYRFQPVSGVTAYHWRASALTALKLFEGAEQGAVAQSLSVTLVT